MAWADEEPLKSEQVAESVNTNLSLSANVV